VRVAVDAMGGDFAPQATVDGTIQAAAAYPHIKEFILVGDESAIRAILGKNHDPRIIVRHASEVIGMNEAPATAIRRKKDSSVGRAAEMVKAGEADAMFSAGNTGAAVTAAKLRMRSLPGADRPAIATVMPTRSNPCMMLDAGANPDSTAHMLCQYAVMGTVYSQVIFGVKNPRVGLLSIGEEDGKGNEITKEAFKLLEKSNLNFVGNVESKDMFQGKVDVVSCDGFVGNVVLKTSEAVASVVKLWLKESLTRNIIRRMAAGILSNAFKEFKSKVDPHSYGGAPLLGCNGICIIGHGSSSAFGVMNGIRVAADAVQHDINHLIIEGLQELEQVK
jgi:glycerol-3-phosphate acyltransferase PlsX